MATVNWAGSFFTCNIISSSYLTCVSADAMNFSADECLDS